MKVENSIIILTIKWSRMKSSFVILIDDREFNKEFVNSITKNWIKHLTLMLQATYKISPIPEIFSFFLLQISSAVFLGAIMLHQLDHSIFYGLHNLRTISCNLQLVSEVWKEYQHSYSLTTFYTVDRFTALNVQWSFMDLFQKYIVLEL